MFKKWTFYKDEDIFCQLEEVSGVGPEKNIKHLCVHNEIYKLTPSTIKKARDIFKRIKLYSKKYRYGVNAYTENERWAKLIDNNYEVLGRFSENGKDYKVLQWL